MKLRPAPTSDAATALAATGEWMDDYNEVHPHGRLGYRSPREYIRGSLNPPSVRFNGAHSSHSD
jgi:putative transposase